MKVQDSLKQEMISLHRQNQEMFTALTDREKDISTLTEKVRNRESTIAELTTYTRHLKKFVLEEDLKS